MLMTTRVVWVLNRRQSAACEGETAALGAGCGVLSQAKQLTAISCMRTLPREEAADLFDVISTITWIVEEFSGINSSPSTWLTGVCSPSPNRAGGVVLAPRKRPKKDVIISIRCEEELTDSTVRIA
ncbi:hypothetical protein C4D60_Mb07t13770 [Musa balbisiana]|uniref:Uncharacterized protein n=1 Tax=Musa balbisiana TaxID=52838 RepID=A0A4S8JFC1_MUSBA|nr:hypothetical protein C4D60_Mb07t13770 [Musa balbisiana]